MVNETKYNPKNKFTRKLLEDIMKRYDGRLLADMVLECKRVMRDYDENEARLSKHSRVRLESWTIKDAHGEPAYFTVKFSMPVVQYIPSYFRLLHAMLRYRWNRSVEYIPCYMMNLNRVALVKIVPKVGCPPDSYRDVGNGIFNRVIYKKGRPMELDSANILLGGKTHDRGIGSSQDIVKRCFELCYWCLPPAKDSGTPSPIHNLIYHTNHSIHNVIRLQKTLLRVIKKGSFPRSIEIVKNNTKYVKADVALLVDDGRTITSEFRKNILLTAGVAQSVCNGDVFSVLISEDVKRRRPLVVGRVGDTVNPGDLKPLLGVIMWRLLQNISGDSSLTRIGNINEISGLVSDMIKDNSTETGLCYPPIAWSCPARSIKRSINEMFPLYVLKNDAVHQISPAVLSFIISTFPGLLEMREPIHTLISLLHILKTGVRQDAKSSVPLQDGAKLQTECSAEKFPGLFLENLPSIVNEMVYSRIFSGGSRSNSEVL